MSALVRLGWCLDEAVQVRFCAVKNRAVLNRNCVVATRGGEQRNENSQSVTPFVDQDEQSELDSVGGDGRACERCAKPVAEGKTLWHPQSGLEQSPTTPPTDTPLMVGDRMAGRPDRAIREIGLGATEFMPLGGRRAAQDEVRAPIVAMKRVMIVERRECRKMEGSWTQRQTTNRCECPRGLCRSGLSQAHMTWMILLNGRRPWRPRAERALSRRDHRLESRMRETRLSGSEGGVVPTRHPYPYLRTGYGHA